MNPHAVFPRGRRTALALAVVAGFSIAAPPAFATTWPVSNCADHGAGSLRDVVSNPSTLSGDTVDLSGLNAANCPGSTITLTTGAIVVPQPTLTLTGPASRITLTGFYNGAYMNANLVQHGNSTGTLYAFDLNFEYARPSASRYSVAKGGCIYSAGNVSLTRVRVFNCHTSGATRGLGGGIYAHGNVTLKYAQVVANSIAASANPPRGGGIYAGGKVSASYSTIAGNAASFGNGGGVFAYGDVSIVNSTLSGNSAGFAAGLDAAGNGQLKIAGSTISGNTSGYVAGVASGATTTTIQSSTIAFNTATGGTPNSSPGVSLTANTSGVHPVDIESSILSNNTYGTTENDFTATPSVGSFTVTSNNSLVRAAPGAVRPATVTTACPLLGPLRDNGGVTLTHALLSRSPAIDAGNNAAGSNEDQRGRPFVDPNNPYPYARVSGTAADIGAYEVQQGDVIFNTGFEGCPVLL